MRLDLTDEEKAALLSLLNRAIDYDRYPPPATHPRRCAGILAESGPKAPAATSAGSAATHRWSAIRAERHDRSVNARGQPRLATGARLIRKASGGDRRRRAGSFTRIENHQARAPAHSQWLMHVLVFFFELTIILIGT